MSAENQETSRGKGIASKAGDAVVLMVYPLWTMKYALASFANLLTLAIGITIGIMLAPHMEKPAKAGGASPESPSAAPSLPAGLSDIERITPVMTTGSIGSYLILAHHTQSDELVVNGLDILKLQQGELNLLSKMPGIQPWDISSCISYPAPTGKYISEMREDYANSLGCPSFTSDSFAPRSHGSRCPDSDEAIRGDSASDGTPNRTT